jgi:signal transduction histidine kinase
MSQSIRSRIVFSIALIPIIILIPTGFSFAQAAGSNFGIFDATAIWTSKRDFSPGEKPIGFVKTNRTDHGVAYDLFGKSKNYNHILRDRNTAQDLEEGFFVYTQRSGSWTLSARVELDYQKSISELAQTFFGIIVREYADEPNSALYAISSRALFEEMTTFYGISPLWRLPQSDLTVQVRRESLLLSRSLPSMTFVYLRMTRIASQNLFFSEWSADGKTWNALHRMIFAMRDSVAYGFFVTGNEFASSPAHVRISEVSIDSPSCFAERMIAADSFYPGDVQEVVVTIHNLKSEVQRFTIQENLPKGWMADSISDGGILDKGTITWSLTAEPGTMALRYLLYSPANTDVDLSLSGNINGMETQGDRYVRRLRMEEKTYLSLSNQWMIIIAIPVVMLLMHLTLFLLAPAMKEHLFYAIYLGNTAISSYTFQNSIHYPTANDYLLLMISWSFTATLLILFLYSLTYRRILFHFWYFLCGSVFFSLLFIFLIHFRQFEVPYYAPGLIIFLIVGYGECLRVVVKELCAAKEGTRIIMFGVLLYILISLWTFFSIFHLVPGTSAFIGIPLINFWIQIVFFLSVSIYLSYRFAGTYRELEQLNVKLEERVEQRTQELSEANEELNTANEYLNQANAELQHANAQLLELDKMKSAFVSQASHDLRTPLTAIKGSLDNLILGIAGVLTEKQEKIMTRAVKSVDRLTDLVNDVLDLSRIESGRMVLEKSNVPIKTLVENIINEDKPAAEQKRIQLSANLETNAIIHADAGKLERVVGELISNAIKYTPEGGSVDVTLTKTEDQITLSVKDSGIGMTKVECEKIWERFYRTNASKTFAKGSGLGLSIAKELVEMHGGTINVESKQGEGTIFILSLPAKELSYA